jgi:hypothetical protein
VAGGASASVQLDQLELENPGDDFDDAHRVLR